MAAHSSPQPVQTASRRFRIITRKGLRRIGLLFLLIAAFLVYGYFTMVRMPGRSFEGGLDPPTAREQALAETLKKHVYILADATGGVVRVGNRSTFWPRRFAEAALYIDTQLEGYGFAERHEYFCERGAPVPNFEVIVPGTSRPSEIIVVGAHYDSFQGSPGADDNASGVAACLVYAQHFINHPQQRTLRFLFFVNEEPPAFQTPDMGSWVYAKACKARGDNVVAMISVESIGYYSDEPGSQKYPAPFSSLYPDTGNFIAFIGNYSSRALVKQSLAHFRATTRFPSQGAALPSVVPGVGWSDHWSFWQEGYPAFMVTDTAVFRHPDYHQAQETADKLDYDRMARVVAGLGRVIEHLANPDGAEPDPSTPAHAGN
ncbi:MAG: M28 family peptidase [Phycisphaeraceae bacterium]|nr:M28 family peptidase [Phycisphaeraceae bacterium]